MILFFAYIKRESFSKYIGLYIFTEENNQSICTCPDVYTMYLTATWKKPLENPCRRGKGSLCRTFFSFFFFVNRFFFFLVGKIRKKEEGGRRRKETCRNFRMSFTFFFLLNIFFYPLIYRKQRRRRIAERYVGLGIPPPQLKPRSLNTFKVVLAYRIQCLIISFFLKQIKFKIIQSDTEKEFPFNMRHACATL